MTSECPTAAPEIPSSQQGVFERAKTSRAAALKAMCLQCVGHVRADVRDCADRSCPLWRWRPYQRASTS